MQPQLELDGAHAAHRVLLDALAGLTDQDAARPSALPGWSVGHVLTHLARNADSHTGMVLAAHAGAVGEQYPGGAARRAADIEAGATRPAAQLVDDVRTSIDRLESAWTATPVAAWAHGRGATLAHGELPLDELVFRRWREVEVHHADLARSFRWADWSGAYVERELARAVAALGPRLPDHVALRIEVPGVVGAWIVEPVPVERTVLSASAHELVAWLLDRHRRPDWPALRPW